MDNEKKGDEESDRDIRRLYVSLSTMGKIFSLMNQDEYTPVPITLQPRSPYFALLDFCHFKANEMSERQGRNRRKREIEMMARCERSPPWAPTIDAKPRPFSSLASEQ